MTKVMILALATALHAGVLNDMVPFFGRTLACDTGEPIELSGKLHVVLKDGGYKFQPAGVQGIGEWTGDVFVGTGKTQFSFDDGQGHYTNIFHIVSKGPRPNLMIHQVLHYRIQQDGAVTILVDETSAVCQ